MARPFRQMTEQEVVATPVEETKEEPIVETAPVEGTKEESVEALHNGISEGTIVPVYCGSATNMWGNR